MKVNEPFVGTPCEIVIETSFPNIIEPEFYTTKYHIKNTASSYICKFDYIRTAFVEDDKGEISSSNKKKYESEAVFNVPDEIINRFVNVLRKGFKKCEYIIIDDGMFTITLTNELGEMFKYEDTYSGDHDELTSIIEELND